jgi:hypothetical protein
MQEYKIVNYAAHIDLQIFAPAHWRFDATAVRFDGTMATIATDFLMSAAFLACAVLCRGTHPLARLSVVYFLLTAVSASFGAFGHIFFGSDLAEGKDFNPALVCSFVVYVSKSSGTCLLTDAI